MGTIENNNGAYESNKDNLKQKEIDYVKIQTRRIRIYNR